MMHRSTLRRTSAAAAVVLLAAVSGCGNASDVTVAPDAEATEDVAAGPSRCADWAAEPPTAEQRAEGCIGANADMYMDAVAAVSECEEWTRQVVTQAEVDRGCRVGPVDLAVTADQDCVDGRTLFWNQAVWGYVGELAHSYRAGADETAPEAERRACRGR